MVFEVFVEFYVVVGGCKDGVVFVYVNVFVWLYFGVVLMYDDVVCDYRFIIVFFDV